MDVNNPRKKNALEPQSRGVAEFFRVPHNQPPQFRCMSFMVPSGSERGTGGGKKEKKFTSLSAITLLGNEKFRG